MRLRNVKGAGDVLEASPFVIKEPSALRGRWAQEFGREAPIWIEIGMGKGRFLMEQAALHADTDFIGVEMYASVLVRAAQKLKDMPGPEGVNIRLLNVPAETLPDILAPCEVQKIFLNFSDPWPKTKHAKRRLTSPEHLRLYEKFLEPGGELEFKTDNVELFEYSLASLRDSAWELVFCSYDIHGERLPGVVKDPEVMTEYELRFVENGQKICKLKAVYPGV